MLVGSSLQAGNEGDGNRGLMKLVDVREAKVVVSTAGAFEHAMCKVRLYDTGGVARVGGLALYGEEWGAGGRWCVWTDVAPCVGIDQHGGFYEVGGLSMPQRVWEARVRLLGPVRLPKRSSL